MCIPCKFEYGEDSINCVRGPRKIWIIGIYNGRLGKMISV